MRYLLIILLSAIALTAQAQNDIQNLTNNDTIETLVENGLSELNIKNIHLTIVPLSDHYKRIKSMARARPWGVAISGNRYTYTIIISLRHEADVGISFSERIAHELIHVYQRYNTIECAENCENQAYKKQYQLANKIRNAVR